MIEINLNLLIGGFDYLVCQNVFTWCFEISANYTGGGVNLISCITFPCVLFYAFQKHMCAFWRCFFHLLVFPVDSTLLKHSIIHALHA